MSNAKVQTKSKAKMEKAWIWGFDIGSTFCF
jgi:hypothetical protein